METVTYMELRAAEREILPGWEASHLRSPLYLTSPRQTCHRSADRFPNLRKEAESRRYPHQCAYRLRLQAGPSRLRPDHHQGSRRGYLRGGSA